MWGIKREKQSHDLRSTRKSQNISMGIIHFWCRGYYVDTVGKYETVIREYVDNQLQEDIMNDQLSLKEFVDPFTGGR